MRNSLIKELFPNLSTIENFLNDKDSDSVIVGRIGGRKFVKGDRKSTFTMNQLVRHIEKLAKEAKYKNDIALPYRLTKVLLSAASFDEAATTKYKVITKNKPIAKFIRSITSKLGLFIYDRKGKYTDQIQKNVDKLYSPSQIKTCDLAFSSPENKKHFIDSTLVFIDKHLLKLDEEIRGSEESKLQKLHDLLNKYSIPYEKDENLKTLKSKWAQALKDREEKDKKLTEEFKQRIAAYPSDNRQDLDNRIKLYTQREKETVGSNFLELLGEDLNLAVTLSNIGREVGPIKLERSLIELNKKNFETDPNVVLVKAYEICQIIETEIDGITFDALLKNIKRWLVKNHPDKNPNGSQFVETVIQYKKELIELLLHITTMDEITNVIHKYDQ